MGGTQTGSVSKESAEENNETEKNKRQEGGEI
jgi:hypothetical protein